MLKLLNKKTFIPFIFILLSVSCGLFSFEVLEVSFNINTMNQVVADDNLFWAEFNMDVVKEEAEKAFSLESPSKEIGGDFSWDGNRLLFSPTVDLKAGLRYRISVTGDINLNDGRSFNVEKSLPFYFMTDEPPPVLTSYSPIPDLPIAAADTLSFTFSREIDEESFIDNFTLDPSTEFTHVLSPDNMTITLTPEEEWINLQKYTWTISTDYTDILGISPVEQYRDTFFVVEDIEAPVLEQLIPVYDVTPGGTYSPRGTLPDEEPLDFLQFHDGILAEFSEEIDFSLFQESISITPSSGSISGIWYDFSPEMFCFVPAEGWDMSAEYTLSISENLTDLYGNIFYMEEPVVFTPDIEEFTIETFTVILTDGSYDIDVSEVDPEIPLDLKLRDAGPEPLNVHQYFQLSLNQPLTLDSEKQDLVNALIPAWSSPFGSGGTPSIFDVSWISDSLVEITWVGFKAYTEGQDIYYLFRLAKGNSTIMLENGSYLGEDIEILFYYAEVDE